MHLPLPLLHVPLAQRLSSGVPPFRQSDQHCVASWHLRLFAHAAAAIVLQVPSPAHVPAVSMLPLHVEQSVVAPGPTHVPLVSQLVAPHTPVVVQAMAQQFPVPLVPQMPLAHS